MHCPNCHSLNSEEKKFCYECGTKLTLLCPQCKMEVRSTHKFCGECGLELNQKGRAKKKQSAGIGGERKNVTVLFSDLSGYTAMSEKLDPEEVREISSRIFTGIAKIVIKYHGFIEKYIGDAILAIFGLPTVYEDDPVRAVSAALEVHRFVQSIGPALNDRINQQLSMHSGIHTGLVVSGEMRVEKGIHGVVGDTLNLASRLADHANPNEIWVSEQTHNLVSPFFKTKPLGQVNLKGITRPIKPHLIIGRFNVKTRFEASQRQGFTNFIGRFQELSKLQACLEKTVTGSGQFVTITGEAGVGKSRLAYEFRHSIDRNKTIILQGRCQSFGGNIPYLPFIDLLKRGLLLKEDDTPSILERKAISNILSIDASLEKYLPLFLHMLSIASSKYRLSKDLRGQKLKKSMNQALVEIILSNTKRNPMVIVFEDWHWVDEASDEILKHLVSQIETYPLMLLVLSRPERMTNWLDWNYHTQFALKSMGPQDTAHAIKSIWKVIKLPDGFSSFIHDRTGGNPFFIEELCKALIEDGSVQIANRKANLLNSLDKLSIPASVQAVIRARLDRLDSHVKEALQLAAVIGREFPLRILERITNASHKLSMSLDVLQSQELIQQIRLIPEADYMFKHVLTQVAVYESLLLKKRKEFHAAVGLTMEELYADRLEEQCEKLAHHYSKSTNMKKALCYIEMAGAKASRVHSLSESRQYYQTALSILDEARLETGSQQKYIDLTLKWAEVSQYAPSNKIRNSLKRSLDYAIKFDKRQRTAEVLYWVAKFGYMQGDFIEAIPKVEECIKLAGELNDHELLAISYNLLGRVCLYTGNYPKSIKYLNKGLEQIRPFEKWDDIVYSTAILGLLMGMTGNYNNSMKTIAEAIKIARKYEILTFEAMAFGYLGSVNFWYGRWKASINNCRKCIAISKRMDNSLPIIWATFFEGATLFKSGDQKNGLRIMEKAIEMMIKMDSVLALRFFYSLFAENLALHGKYAYAESMNKKAMEIGQSGQQWGEISSYRAMAILATAGRYPDWNKVEMNMNKSIEISTSLGAITELLQSLYRFSDLMRKKGDIDREQFYYNQGMDLAEKIGCNVN